MYLLCLSWFTTTNLSYRFPIFETSAIASCGTTGSNQGTVLKDGGADVPAQPRPVCFGVNTKQSDHGKDLPGFEDHCHSSFLGGEFRAPESVKRRKFFKYRGMLDGSLTSLASLAWLHMSLPWWNAISYHGRPNGQQLTIQKATSLTTHWTCAKIDKDLFLWFLYVCKVCMFYNYRFGQTLAPYECIQCIREDKWNKWNGRLSWDVGGLPAWSKLFRS